jgi:diguanylate cyclase (GGDEF)-like protein
MFIPKASSERKIGSRILVAIAASYVLDGILLAGFASAGTIGTAIPLAYTATGLIACATFLWITARAQNAAADGSLALSQVLVSSAIQLSFVALAPPVAFYFFTVLFIVFGCGGLGLSARQSALAWIAVAIAAIFVALLHGARISIPQATALERTLVWLCFVATLGRFILLGLFGRMLRLRLQDRRRQLRDSVDALQERDNSLARVNQELRRQATHDALTGIANRKSFVESLESAVAAKRPFAVCVLDLDRFKVINDSLGHAAGDALLQHVAGQLTAITRASDVVARAGGDEFLLLLRNVESTAEAEGLALRCASAIAQPHLVASLELHVLASIGIARFPQDGSGAEQLLSRADEAMSCAKRSGRNAVRFFDAAVMGYSRERLKIEGELRSALANGQFHLHYQPKVDIATDDIRSVEALLRWQHPTRGTVPPGDFISIAEESGLIVELGAWVIREACRQARDWQVRGLPFLRVAVNVSPVQFRQSNFVSVINAALAEHSLLPTYLEIELTEATLMSNAETSVALLEELSAIGVLLSVDDFGTGYSSMSYLQRFPIDKLKIDRSFISDVVTNPDDASIVRAIISLAHGLRLKVIAEGVESAQQLQLLKTMGCDQYQGYFRSAAVPAIDVERIVNQDSARRKDKSEPGIDQTQTKLLRLRL